MRHELKQKPDFAALLITFDAAGEAIRTETSAMLARHPNIKMETNLSGGIFAAAKRKLLGGESLFMNTFTATAPGQTLWLAPGPEGDIETMHVQPGWGIYMASGAFLAAGTGVNLDTKWGGAKGFFSGAGLFLLKCEGDGPVFFSCYGGIHAVDIGPQGYVCVTGHILAFTAGLNYQVKGVGGLKSLLASGEGLVAQFNGQGRLWMSTRKANGLAAFVHPFRAVQRSN